MIYSCTGFWRGLMVSPFTVEAYLSPISACCRQEAVQKAKNELKLSFLELEWEDTTSFCITDESLSRCCQFVHQARASGSSVLVHCAQVCVCVGGGDP